MTLIFMYNRSLQYMALLCLTLVYTAQGSFQTNVWGIQQQRHMLSARDVLSTSSLPPSKQPYSTLQSVTSSDNSPSDGSTTTTTTITTTTSSTTPARKASSLPKRKRKKRVAGSSSANKSSNNKKIKGPLSEQDLADHVSAMYIHGPGGILRETAVRRQRRQAELNKHHHHEDDDQQHQAQQLASLRKLDRHPALLLNADYQPMSWLPLSLWNWQEAVKAVFSGKVTVVDVYPDVTIRAASLEVPLPAVIALTEYVPQHQQTPAFTKRNVFLRDEYRCQYCNDLFHTRDLSLDHVVPRCRGGRLHWENAVTCCRKCNGRKGSYDVKDIARLYGMQLRKLPRTPTQYELAATASRMLPRRVHPTWEPFLGMQFKKSKQKMSSSSLSNSSRKEQQHHATLEEEF